MGVDLGTLRLLPRILKAMVGGDDQVLGNLIGYLEERGFRVIGAHEVAPELVAEAGQLAGPRAAQATLDDARVAMAAARAIGERDIGQAAVAVNGLVVAVEAAEGTDAMLERVGDLHAMGRVKWSGRAGVLAKCSKPQQDLRVDMPTIGPRTVTGVVKAGLAGIVIEAGRVMIAERAETLARGRGQRHLHPRRGRRRGSAARGARWRSGPGSSDASLAQILSAAISARTALSFLVVQMLFVPCVATVAAMRAETGSWRWTIAGVLLLLVVSFAGGMLAFQLAGLF